ncbi:MAG: CarD family transcriptional regulator [Devosiaceae bacterium]|nr:CarD family transcriptional regulator [Devosiaceae bacterium]
MATVKKSQQRAGFKTGEFVVYPAHGVGKISSIDSEEIAGLTLELLVIYFEQDKLTLRVPVAKIKSVGMRKLANEEVVAKALSTVAARARVKRTMWSRRAQEYEAKINSGDLIFIAEVVRDLYRSSEQPEQSYSERQLFEQAMDRMGREIGTVNKITITEAVELIQKSLDMKVPRIAKSEEAKSENGANEAIETKGKGKEAAA